MDIITLPLIQAGAGVSVGDAMEELRCRRRSGLIVEEAGNYRLLYIRHLLEAKERNIEVLSEVPDGYPVSLTEPDDPDSVRLEFARPMRVPSGYADILSAATQDYVLAKAAPYSAVIVTRHEGLRQMLASTGGFKCNGKDTHYFPDPEVVDGQECPKSHPSEDGVVVKPA